MAFISELYHCSDYVKGKCPQKCYMAKRMEQKVKENYIVTNWVECYKKDASFCERRKMNRRVTND